jgi:hypothetical protein
MDGWMVKQHEKRARMTLGMNFSEDWANLLLDGGVA